MKFTTAITQLSLTEGEVVRGYKLSDLVQHRSFVETTFLILLGRLPSLAEQRVLDAILTSVVDHGPSTGSALTARISASAKNPLHVSLAAGLLGMGERHITALTPAMQFLYDHVDDPDLVALMRQRKAEKKYVPGFGHRLRQLEEDSRSTTLFAVAKEQGIFGKYCDFSFRLKEALDQVSSKKLPLNIDGAVAAVLCDMGFDPILGTGIFVIGRMPGLVAHIMEEIAQDEGIRRIEPEDVEYTGSTGLSCN